MNNVPTYDQFLNESSIYKPKDIDKEYKKLSRTWEAYLDKKFIGSSITAVAYKQSDRSHTWDTHEINNITEVSIKTYFGTEILVKDSNGEWYILSSKW